MTNNQRANLHMRIDADLETLIRAYMHKNPRFANGSGDPMWLAKDVRAGLLRHYEVRERRRR